uniref:Uncharacterized protein n=1 Tax=Caenorhabditis japonica TaxID=281687 RepID=A0A8R1E592_CAEJA
MVESLHRTNGLSTRPPSQQNRDAQRAIKNRARLMMYSPTINARNASNTDTICIHRISPVKRALSHFSASISTMLKFSRTLAKWRILKK